VWRANALILNYFFCKSVAAFIPEARQTAADCNSEAHNSCSGQTAIKLQIPGAIQTDVQISGDQRTSPADPLGAAFQVNLKQVNAASAAPTMSGRARPTFGSGSSGLGKWKLQKYRLSEIIH